MDSAVIERLAQARIVADLAAEIISGFAPIDRSDWGTRELLRKGEAVNARRYWKIGQIACHPETVDLTGLCFEGTDRGH